jgi:hypothetical protein
MSADPRANRRIQEGVGTVHVVGGAVGPDQLVL